MIENAPTIMEHIDAFSDYSQFKVWKVNTCFGFPKDLSKIKFKIILLHYSLFGAAPFGLAGKFLDYVKESNSSYKIAFFQDEYHFCPHRFHLIDQCKLDCIYTLVEPLYFKNTYEKYTKVPKIFYNLTGYVSDNLIEIAELYFKPDKERQIDIGYRGRQLPFYMGKGAQEKHFIGVQFRKLAFESGLNLDIETEESKRIYGNKWFEFLANCKAVLGVEAGVSIFDLKDTVRQSCEETITNNPRITFNEIYNKFLHKYENNIPYRTISPRHFEASAFRVCQILFEGKYSGILKPMVHYIPLKKDFSNFDEVIKMFNNQELRHRLTEKAYQDLIASGNYSYRNFIKTFDDELMVGGLQPNNVSGDEIQYVETTLKKGSFYRLLRSLPYRQLPFRKQVINILRPFIKRHFKKSISI